MHSLLIILSILSAILCAGLGLFTLTRNPRHPANIGFTLGMLSLALIGAGSAVMLYSGVLGGGAALGVRLTLIGEAVLPAAWLLFSVVFARSNYMEMLKKWAPVLAASALISVFFALWSGSSGFISIPQSGVYILGPVGRYFYIYLTEDKRA